MSSNHHHDQPVIFDFGGVLIDWNPLYLYDKIFSGDRQKAQAFLQEIGFAEWNIHQDAGRPFSVAVAEHSQRFPQYADLIRVYDERYPEAIAGPIQGTVDILQRLKQAGCSLHGLSNWPGEKWDLVHPQYPFFDWFESIVISGKVMLAKPDPRIFELCLQGVGAPASECLYIDDSLTNLEVAGGLGFQTIHFRSPALLEQELQARGLEF